jgi:hypothetical protein
MYVGVGLRKNRHGGVWIVRIKVPERLEGPVACLLNNGKEPAGVLAEEHRH